MFLLRIYIENYFKNYEIAQQFKSTPGTEEFSVSFLLELFSHAKQ